MTCDKCDFEGHRSDSYRSAECSQLPWALRCHGMPSLACCSLATGEARAADSSASPMAREGAGGLGQRRLRAVANHAPAASNPRETSGVSEGNAQRNAGSAVNNA